MKIEKDKIKNKNNTKNNYFYIMYIYINMDSITNRSFESQKRFTLNNVFNFQVGNNYLQNEIKRSGKVFNSSDYTRYRQLVALRRKLYS